MKTVQVHGTNSNIKYTFRANQNKTKKADSDQHYKKSYKNKSLPNKSLARVASLRPKAVYEFFDFSVINVQYQSKIGQSLNDGSR